MKPRHPIPVTDHAVVQYLARQWGVNVPALKARIGRIGAVAVENGASAITVHGLTYVIQDDKVITALGKGMRVKKANPAKRRK